MKQSQHFTTERMRAVAAAAMAVAFFAGTSGALAQWPQWGGPHQDFKADSKGLADEWPEGGPKQLWKRDLGEGYSGILVDGGRLYTMYRPGNEEAVIALDAKTGDTIWEHKYAASPAEGHVDQFGKGPRSTPLISGDRLFTIGVSGKMLCLDKNDGKVQWSHDLWKEFDGNVLQHGYSSSPIAYKNTVIVLVGGAGASIVALNQDDGKVVWKNQSFENSYSTPKIINVDGEDQLVTFMATEAIGVDPDDGSLEWQYPHQNQWKQNVCQPNWNDKHNVLFFSNSGAGARGLKLTRNGAKTEIEELWSTRKIHFYHVNSVTVGDYVYGSTGNRAPNFFAAINMLTGKIAWRKRGFAKANCVYADGKFIILDEDGQLALATATPEEFVVHSKVALLGRVSWTVPTVVGNNMYIRDKTMIMALDLG